MTSRCHRRTALRRAEALQTLLDGLGRIRDQLGAVSTPAADAST